MKLGTFPRAAMIMACTLAAAAAAFAQTDSAPATTGITLPTKVEFLDTANPGVRKATAIVNGDVITGTDVDQRMALIVAAAGGNIPPEEMQRLRDQVLRNLVDETLQIQAAETRDIKIEQSEIDSYYRQYAQVNNRTPAQLTAFLKAAGSSEASFRRQIHGEIAWTKLQRARIEPFVNISEEEVRAIIDRLNANRGTQEYRVGEIFLSATPENAAVVRANAERIIEQIRGGASFQVFARQYSEATTAAVGGDLGWVRAEQLPEALAEAVRQMPVGAISNPIPIPGGFSIIYMQDSRKILTADPRDAILSLKQISINFPPGMTREQAQPRIEQLAETSRTMGGCGGAEEAAARIGAEVVSSDQIKVRDLPPALQEALLRLSIGQALPPFGTFEEGVRTLVLCGRDDPEQTSGPSFDQVYAQLSEERVSRRAQRYLRDLRRDAVVDYR